MINLTIDGMAVTVPAGTSIIEACKQLNIEIPVFCYHPLLKVAGNCRMCLVEVEGCQKLAASCAYPVNEAMVVHTNSPIVIDTRRGILELLLINHPLDCPICDEGGECDLQDITMNYGPSNSRFNFYKRAVPNIELGPLIKTIMNRCIHCTRCVRFASDIAGAEELGTKGRGEHSEIISYLNRPFASELSGNIIELCPVGALTSKPYAFHGRPWELIKVPSIDITDAVGSHIHLEQRHNEILRVTPRHCPSINSEWIGDKVRFFYDGIALQRLDSPYLKIDNKLVKCSWDEALQTIVEAWRETAPHEIAALSGEFADFESQLLLAKLLDNLKINNRDCRIDETLFDNKIRNNYLFNSKIENIEQADQLLIVGCNPRVEATTLNARIKMAANLNTLKISLIGTEVNLTYPYQLLGTTSEALAFIDEPNNHYLQSLKLAKKPLLILGAACFKANNKHYILSKINLLKELVPQLEVNVLCIRANTVAGLDAGLVPPQKNSQAPAGLNTSEILRAYEAKQLKILYLLNANVNLTPGKAFVIYHGHHGDATAQHANVILPSLCFAEKSAYYANVEGVYQKTCPAITGPELALNDWHIIDQLALKLKVDLSKLFNQADGPNEWQSEGDHIPDLRRDHFFATLFNSHIQTFESRTFEFEKFDLSALTPTAQLEEPIKVQFQTLIPDYYQSNIICQNSQNMAKCSQTFILNNQQKIQEKIYV